MSGAKPFVSVVIPAFNAEDTLKDCLDALANQSYLRGKYEILVIDDGSTDATPDIAESGADRVIYQENQGPAIARNTGVDAARGEIILFTDADCVACETFVEQMINPLADPAVVGVKGAYRTHQKRMWARFAQIEFEERYAKLAKTEFIDFVDSHAAAFRKDVFLEVGGFDPHFPVANNEDVDLSYKIARLGYPMIFNQEAIVYHTHPDSAAQYLKLKFLRAYWRMLVYRRFPEKILSDTYTPQTLKLQIVSLGLLFLTVFSSLIFPGALTIVPWFFAAFILSVIPFIIRTGRSDSALLWFSPIALILRSVVFGLGIISGFLSQRRRDLLFPALLISGDIVAVSVAYITAFWIRALLVAPMMKPFDHTFQLYLYLLPIILFIMFLSSQAMGLYRTNYGGKGVGEFAGVTRAVSMATLTVITLSFFWKWDYSRFFILAFWFLAVVFCNIVRITIRSLQYQLRKKGLQTIRALIVGTGETAKLVVSRLRDSTENDVIIVGVVDDVIPDMTGDEWRDIAYLGKIEKLDDIIRSESIDDVYIARPDLPHKDILDLVVQCEKTGAGFKIISDLLSIVTGKAGISDFAGLPIVDLKEERHDWGRRMAKKLVDLVLGSLILVLLFPLLLLISVIVHLSIPGSVLVREERVGKNGRLFKMYRFRVHVKGHGSGEDTPGTRVGRFLRKSYFEELPQILNVIRNEMSLVGPRPEVPEIVATYEIWQRKRLELPPGITGLWQIITPGDRPLHEDLEYDFYYIKNYSIWMDLSILLQTIPIILFGKKSS